MHYAYTHSTIAHQYTQYILSKK